LQGNLEKQKNQLRTRNRRIEKHCYCSRNAKASSAAVKKDQEYYLGLTEAQYQAQLKERNTLRKSSGNKQAIV
jgi:hypothetical protein